MVDFFLAKKKLPGLGGANRKTTKEERGYEVVGGIGLDDYI